MGKLFFMSINKNKIQVLILAAGKGKRMMSDLPKVLMPVKGKPMVRYVVDEVVKALDVLPVAIVGHKADLVKNELGEACDYVLQTKQLGTGHAVACARGLCLEADQVVVLSGDQPFITAETIKNLVDKHFKSGAKASLTTAEPENFEGFQKAFLSFGRILRKAGEVIGIREYKDASDEEKNIKEVNAGCYVFDALWLFANLEKLKNDNTQGEYYLTDVLKMAFESGDLIESIKIAPKEALGANSREELEILESIF
jgi:bifunctional UDP-N-acetylglucosamine pyrophosphorylase / glucosamine-1-phosphate N-acetyltransferase